MKTIDVPFMDQVHRMTFEPKPGGLKMTPQARAVMARHRVALRRAERFVLDDDAVRLVCHLSHEKQKLASWSFLARLPFDTFWVEFNLHAKVAEFEKMRSLRVKFEPGEVSPHWGMLFQRDLPGSTSPRWVVSQFCQVGDDAVLPAILGFVFDPEGEAHSTPRGSDLWRTPTLSLRPGFDRRAPMLQEDTGEQEECDWEYLAAGDFHRDSGGRLVPGDWFLNRGAVIVEPYWDAMGRMTNHIIAEEMKEQAGMVRWIVAMLAAINGLPRDLVIVSTRPGKQSVGMNVLPYFQHRTIKILMPKEDRVSWSVRNLDRTLRNTPRAWHQVIGHWRIIEKGKVVGRAPGQPWCRHIPTMVEHGVGMCERCQLMIRWIPSHTRGDPNLGIVEHTYRGVA